jgi:Rrf2 family protein
MELPQTVEWALHCCWLLAQRDDVPLPRRQMAEFYGLPEPYLAKTLKALTGAGILVSISGPRGGYRLAREASEISALDVVTAVDGGSSLFHCMEIRQRGPAGLSPDQCRQACGIASLMHSAEMAWRNELATSSIADILSHASAGSRSRATSWLRGEMHPVVPSVTPRAADDLPPIGDNEG